MILSKYKFFDKNKKDLTQLPKILQKIEDIKILYSPKEFSSELFKAIREVKQRIYLVTLYLEQDKGGQKVLEEIFQAKKRNPNLEIKIVVDWHRAQRCRIGSKTKNTNVDWYYFMTKTHPDIKIPIYGVPISTREALGILHLKGFIIDDLVIYSGASLNNYYLHQESKYRYDRYHIIRNLLLADTMQNYINKYFVTEPAINRLDFYHKLRKSIIKHYIRLLRQSLKKANYSYCSNAKSFELGIVPLVGLGKKNLLNKTIKNLLCITHKKLIICTPYFNMPTLLIKNIINLLYLGKQIEIIVGDKTANDFYIPIDKPFKIISIIPYFYEINLRRFLNKFKFYLKNNQLVVRLWKDGENSYHIKGIWVDDIWQLLTSNNLNPRSWQLDLENALLIHDPNQSLHNQNKHELSLIRIHTTRITDYTMLQNISEYPIKVRRLINRLHKTRIDRLINKIL